MSFFILTSCKEDIKEQSMLNTTPALTSTPINLNTPTPISTSTPTFVPINSGMVLIEGGSFERVVVVKVDYKKENMGGYYREYPVNTITEVVVVEINSFYIGKYELTNGEYSAYDPNYYDFDPDLPVMISWKEALEYCNWLSEEESLNPCYSIKERRNSIFCDVIVDINKNGYRLPTREEWQHACWTEKETAFYWGDDMDEDYCWIDVDCGKKVHKVGQKKPNDFGLYDMIGNAPEWCNYEENRGCFFWGIMFVKNDKVINYSGAYYNDFKISIGLDKIGFRLARSYIPSDN